MTTQGSSNTRQTQRLLVGVWAGLAALAPDALSSIAYGPQEMIIQLEPAGLRAEWYILPLGFVLIFLLGFLVFSYRQIIQSYPNGGGSYVIGQATFGSTIGILAGSSLIIDYIMTVAVSVTAGVDALVSAFPSLQHDMVTADVLIIVAIMVLNLQGVRKTAQVLSPVTYLFIAMILMMATVGLVHPFQPIAPHPKIFPLPSALPSVGVLMLLRSYTSGSSALTGIESVSNAVPIFKAPSAKFAKRTETLLGIFLGSMYVGVILAALREHAMPTAHMTLLQQIAQETFGHGVFFYLLSFVTMAILAIGANTSFTGLPQLASLMSWDQWMPRMFLFRNDQDVYRNGIFVLGGVAAFLVLLFNGNINRLIPMYAIGVYLSFTIAQVSLIKKALTDRRAGKPTVQLRVLPFVAIGSLLTMAVVISSIISKFQGGAWIIVIAIPLMMWGMVSIRRRYRTVDQILSLAQPVHIPPSRPSAVLVPVDTLNQLTVQALHTAQYLAPQVIALHIAPNEAAEQEFAAVWAQSDTHGSLHLRTTSVQNASVMESLMAYIEDWQQQNPGQVLWVILPILTSKNPWEGFLYNQFERSLHQQLVFGHNIMVTTMPFPLQQPSL
ncbi:APC family permease [Sulfobacillus sp. hq2]|uniref:APC family permease n=1 Tax=Sulfobacillus TaxID=28033 RepID=UPI000CD129ED|nr:APC family permease [Sulfobacillus sp. hq2]POB09614.1 amino acid transporter [Sulfobacillus sp. hq2]